MADSYKKSSLLLARAKVAAGAVPSVVSPLKTRIYSKNPLGEDPTQFSNTGFGTTGLQQTPSIIGMGRGKQPK